MTSNCLRALFALVVCVVCVRFINAEEPAKQSCPDGVSISSSIIEETDNEFVVELTITGRSEQGVPMLSKIPYVSRLFKNVGVGRVTTSVAVPKHQVIGVDFDLPADSEKLPEPYFLDDDVQYFSAETPARLVTWQKGCDIDGCLQQVKTKGKAKPKQEKKARKGCQCDSCGCGKSHDARAAKLEKKLMMVAAENAQLRAWAEAQEEIAAAKEEFLREMMVAKVEIVRLQMQAESNIARRHQHEQYDQQVDEHHHTTVYDLQHENAKLKAIIAELEKRALRR